MSETIAHSLDAKIRTEDVLTKEHYNFDSLLLPNSLLQGLKEAGFLKPSPIQLKAIPLGTCGLDLIVKAKSGMGKTAVFTIIALEMINTAEKALQVLIFAPTREVAVQIQGVIQTIGMEIRDLHVSLFIGGLSMENDIENAKGCHIAVGTLGRLKHLVEEGHLNIESVRLLVFDEVDKLMEDCFKNEIDYIYCKLPDKKQVIAVSSTYPDELHGLLKRYMKSPTFVTPEVDNSILLGLRQFVTVVKATGNVVQLLKSKTEELIRLLSKISFTQCLVFFNYQNRTESISNILNHKGWNNTYISAGQSQVERLKSYHSLKKFQCRILLSTDLTARGIDASNVDVVINYDMPHHAATYLHRMGRAGRYGSRGLCITIADDGDELKTLQGILGEIGGSELSIAKLPSEEKVVGDIWECNMSSFETVLGDLKETENFQNKNYTLEKSVLELKNNRDKQKIKDENSKNSGELEMENAENKDKSNVKSVENKDDSEVKGIENKELSIAKLPSEKKVVADIWECDMSSLETVHADLRETENLQNKNATWAKSVLELKNNRDKQKIKYPRSKQETDLVSTDAVKGIENKAKSEHSRFSSYFEYYSQVLADDNLTFENVKSFDNWFNQWQLQVTAVRDYVQQNIYLQEMNNYQQNCNSYHGRSYDKQDN